MSNRELPFPADDFSDDFDAVPEWLLGEQEDCIRDADELPFLRPSLRREFIAEVASIDRQRERRRRAVLVTLLLLALAPLWWLAQLWPERAIAQHVPFEMRSHSMLPRDTEESLESLPLSIGGAVQDPDAFKLVDAFSELKQKHAAHIRLGAATSE